MDLRGAPIYRGSLLYFRLFLIIPFPFAVNTAAVLLAVKVHRLGDVPAVGVAFPQVGVKKHQPLFPRHHFTGLLD